MKFWFRKGIERAAFFYLENPKPRKVGGNKKRIKTEDLKECTGVLEPWRGDTSADNCTALLFEIYRFSNTNLVSFPNICGDIVISCGILEYVANR